MIKDFIIKNKYLIILGIFALVFVIPLFAGTMIYGHDILFHMGRIECVADNIATGKWFSPMYYTQLDSYGYAAPLYYGDLFLYIPGLIRYLGASMNFSMRLFLVMIFVATIFISYRCFYLISKNKTGAFVATIIYAFSPYFVADLLLRVAVGEAQAFAFMPIIALGFYSIVFEDSEHWLCLPLGLSACLFSHTLSSVIAVAFLGIFSLFSIKQFIQNKKRIGYMIASVLLFFAITAVYMLPLIEQMNSATFYMTSGASASANGTLADRATPWKFLFIDLEFLQYFLKKVFSIKIVLDTPCGLGLVPIICVGTLLAFWKKASKKAIILILTAFLTAIICTNLFPWSAFQDVFGIIQFPWRLYIVVEIAVALGVAFLLPSLENEKWKRIIAVGVVGFGLFSFMSVGTFRLMSMVLTNPDEANETVYNYLGSAEMLPYNKSYDFLEIVDLYTNRGKIITSNNLTESDVEFERQKDVLNVTYKNNQDGDTYLDLPLVMYKGYRAIDSDGGEPALSYGENKVVRVEIGDKKEGSIKVWYEGTTLYKISKLITVLSLVLTFAYMLIRKRKENSNGYKN